MKKTTESVTDSDKLKTLHDVWMEKFEKEFPIKHYYCEDSWYSCPKAPDGCADAEEIECNCRAEDRHDKLKQFLTEYAKAMKAEGREEAVKEGIELMCLGWEEKEYSEVTWRLNSIIIALKTLINK